MCANAWEAVRRLADPGELAGWTVKAVAANAIVANGLSAWLLMAGQ
jgi:Co/Zn/Cd efflux system component